ncbi:thioredoxin family protein [Erwinia sp. PK3-005]
MLILFRSLLLLLGCVSAAQAADTGWLRQPSNPHTEIRIRSAAPQDGQVRMLLDVRLDPGWKTYWRSPGDGGAPPRLNWQPAVSSHWYWPVPQRFDVAGLTTQGYEHSVTFPVVIGAPAQGELQGTLSLSTCSNLCVLTDYAFHLLLSDAPADDFENEYARAMRNVPSEQGPVTVTATQRDRDTITVTAQSPTGWRNPAIFADNPSGTLLSEPKIVTRGEQLQATFHVSDEWGGALSKMPFSALSLVVSDNDIKQQLNVELSSEAGSGLAFWQIILTALLGGLILNLMPCVLPVLGLKLSAIVSGRQYDRRDTQARFLATTGGIVVSFILLAMMMTGLRLTGAWYGWGIQFQSPWFIGFMVLVTYLFSMNMAGVFELRLPSAFSTRLATVGGLGMAGSFFEGIFATLLATPCTAPFLGTAVGFALAAPLPQLWAIFIALGIGMSLPWLAVSLFPAVARLFPKPGRWMQVMRAILLMLMVGSCVWLMSLLIPFFGFRYVLLAGGSLIALLLYLLARQYLSAAENLRTAAFGVLFAAVVYAFLAPAPAGKTASPIHWQPLSEAALQQALDDGKSVFIDITADWCLNCKVNEVMVLHRPEVVSALNQQDVVALQGNWSRPSPEIEQFLYRHGGSGIPFNAIFSAAEPQGEKLSPLLNKQTLLDALKRSSAGVNHAG